MKDFERVYETMLGLLEDEACAEGVENAFAGGSLCARLGAAGFMIFSPALTATDPDHCK